MVRMGDRRPLPLRPSVPQVPRKRTSEEEGARALDRLVTSFQQDDDDASGNPPKPLDPGIRRGRNRLVGLMVIVFVAVLVGQFLVRGKSADPMTAAMAQPNAILPTDIHVIDGDTIRLLDRRPDVRLVGFNAPETIRTRCPAETALGEKAKQRLREIVSGGNLQFEFVTCACPPGTEGTDACNFGRRCGVLKSSGRDVGATLMAEGLAVPFVCGATSCPVTPRPWC